MRDRIRKQKWYSYAVAACIAVAFYVLLVHLRSITDGIATFIGYFGVVILGGVIAYVINPLAKMMQHSLFKGVKNDKANWYLNQIACAMAYECYHKSDFFLAMKNSGRVHLDRVSFNHHKKQFFLKTTQTLFSCSDYHHTNSIASNSIYILSMLLRKAGNIVIATDLKEVLCLLKFLISSMKRPLFTT